MSTSSFLFKMMTPPMRLLPEVIPACSFLLGHCYQVFYLEDHAADLGRIGLFNSLADLF